MDITKRNTVIDALEVAFAESGFTDMYRVVVVARGFVDQAAPVLSSAQSRHALDDYFASYREADEEALDRILPIVLAAPRLFREFLQNAVRQSAATYPVRPWADRLLSVPSNGEPLSNS